MNRLRRIILNALTVLSLLLCVGMAGLWVRSYWVVDLVERCNGSTRSGQWLTSVYGALYFGAMHESGGVRGYFLHGDGISYGAYGNAHRPPDRHFLGFYLWREKKTSPDYRFGFGVPYWFLVVSAAAMPGIRGVRSLRRRRQHTPGLCPTCGYDLRATPDRCPECGATPTKTQA
jgi:hypothetical protein